MRIRGGIVMFSFFVVVAAGAGERAAFPGLKMAAYTAPDQSFSMLYPAGWTASPQEAGITFAQDASDDSSTHIDVFVLQFGEQAFSSEQIVGLLEAQMKQQYPSLKIVQQKQLSPKPDIRGVLFSYREGAVPMSGFGLVLSTGKAAIWSDIYGKDAGFTGYNPVVLLSYVLQSLAQGPKPNRPSMQVAQKPPQPPPSGRNNQKKIDDAAVMTHFWNNAHHIVPDAFSTYVPPLF